MLKVFNTMTKAKEEFKPLHDKEVRMYVCGPTVYGPGHIGHARTYVAFDIIRRYLEYAGYKVRHVINLTDIHDDMIKEANKQEITIKELAEKNIPIFFKDMDGLYIKKADAYPRVTENIDGIIEMTAKLLENGYAYKTEDGVYYAIKKFKNYGKLSRIRLSEEKTGTRVKTDKYDKEHPSDFALWKKAKEGEPAWESKFGNGRPGWHIECSVMSTKELGYPIDIHGGAVDLIFPHHENEIAQSEGYFGKGPFVKYWLHTGFLNVKGEKMAKSLGNFITIPELLEKYNPKGFRYFIAEAHYRSRIDFNESSMEKAKNSLEKINRFAQALAEVKGEKENKKVLGIVEKTKKKFVDVMNNDFNTPLAIAALHEFVSKGNELLNSEDLGKKDAEKILNFLKEIDSVFGFITFEKEKLELEKEIIDLIEKREKLREAGKWKEADEIRSLLKKKGYQLLDTKDGPKVERI